MTDEGEIQLWDKIQLLLWSQTDLGSTFASVIDSLF